MAITTTTISVNPGWASSSLINQLESAFDWLGLHGSTDSGLVVGVTTFTAGIGGTTTNSDDFHDVPTTSVSGIGTGLTLDVFRTNGVIDNIYVNRPGYGYTGGEIVTVSAANIGGAANGAANFQVKVSIAATVTGRVSYACTFSNVSGSNFIINGLDRNGAVGGANTTITIKEGDTLTLRNSYGYSIGIAKTSERYGYVRHSLAFNAPYDIGNGSDLVWSPLPGQAGTYYISADYNFVSGGKVVVLPADTADVNPIGYGTTSSFYYKQLSSSGYNSGAILKQTINPNKKYGTTYRMFLLYDDYNLILGAGSGFHPYAAGSLIFGAMSYSRRWVGADMLDSPRRPTGDNYSSFESVYGLYRYNSQNGYNKIFTGSNTGYKLDLNIYRSGIDPSFSVLSYKAPTLSSQKISDNTYGTFILHNFESSNIWDLDELFVSGFTHVISGSSGTGNFRPSITFRTYTAGNINQDGNYYHSKRAAEFGYSTMNGSSNYINNYVDDVYVSSAAYNPSEYYYSANSTNKRIYYRSASQAPERGSGGYNGNRQIASSADFNAVIKGVPINGQLVPVPYYMPDDFVLIDFSYNLPGVNIQQNDTITVSPSEVYKVIAGSYVQSIRTTGILFCARYV